MTGWELPAALVIIVLGLVFLYGGSQKQGGKSSAILDAIKRGAKRKRKADEIKSQPVRKGDALWHRMRARARRDELVQDRDSQRRSGSVPKDDAGGS